VYNILNLCNMFGLKLINKIDIIYQSGGCHNYAKHMKLFQKFTIMKDIINGQMDNLEPLD
jgi:hypothetical protein